MARKGGNPDLAKYRFTSGSERAKKAQIRSVEVQKQKHSVFKTVRAIVDDPAPDLLLNDNIVLFWKMRGIPRSKITPMMAELTPIYANAVNKADIFVLERIYKILGLSFESSKEQNVNVALSNADDKPLKHDISGGLAIEFIEVKPEPVEENEQVEV